MSLLEAQEWLSRRIDNKKPLYAVMVQIKHDNDTDYRMIWTERGEHRLSPLLSDAEWQDRSMSRYWAKKIIGCSSCIKTQTYEVTRAFIVEKDTEYRVIEEVKIDLPES